MMNESRSGFNSYFHQTTMNAFQKAKMPHYDSVKKIDSNRSLEESNDYPNQNIENKKNSYGNLLSENSASGS